MLWINAKNVFNMTRPNVSISSDCDNKSVIIHHLSLVMWDKTVVGMLINLILISLCSKNLWKYENNLIYGPNTSNRFNYGDNFCNQCGLLQANDPVQFALKHASKKLSDIMRKQKVCRKDKTDFFSGLFNAAFYRSYQTHWHSHPPP